MKPSSIKRDHRGIPQVMEGKPSGKSRACPSPQRLPVPVLRMPVAMRVKLDDEEENDDDQDDESDLETIQLVRSSRGLLEDDDEEEDAAQTAITDRQSHLDHIHRMFGHSHAQRSPRSPRSPTSSSLQDATTELLPSSRMSPISRASSTSPRYDRHRHSPYNAHTSPMHRLQQNRHAQRVAAATALISGKSTPIFPSSPYAMYNSQRNHAYTHSPTQHHSTKRSPMAPMDHRHIKKQRTIDFLSTDPTNMPDSPFLPTNSPGIHREQPSTSRNGLPTPLTQPMSFVPPPLPRKRTAAPEKAAITTAASSSSAAAAPAAAHHNDRHNREESPENDSQIVNEVLLASDDEHPAVSAAPTAPVASHVPMAMEDVQHDHQKAAQEEEEEEEFVILPTQPTKQGEKDETRSNEAQGTVPIEAHAAPDPLEAPAATTPPPPAPQHIEDDDPFADSQKEPAEKALSRKKTTIPAPDASNTVESAPVHLESAPVVAKNVKNASTSTKDAAMPIKDAPTDDAPATMARQGQVADEERMDDAENESVPEMKEADRAIQVDHDHESVHQEQEQSRRTRESAPPAVSKRRPSVHASTTAEVEADSVPVVTTKAPLPPLAPLDEKADEEKRDNSEPADQEDAPESVPCAEKADNAPHDEKIAPVPPVLVPVEPETAAQVEKEMAAPTANAIDTTTESKMTKNEPTRRERIQKEIDLLTETVEALRTDYKVVDRIGYGTFSTVYKCIDLKYNRYDNDDWTSHNVSDIEDDDNDDDNNINDKGTAADDQKEDQEEAESDDSATDDGKNKENKPETQRHGVVATKKRVRYVALKQVYCTSSPKRMAHEISILQQLKGMPSIVQLITAFREGEHVFVVMPFFPSDDFKETYRSMTLNDTKHYLIEILTAVSHLHQLRIIHRDIKPNNFLYNIKKKKGVLIDFGLAQSEDEMRPLEPPKSSSSKTSSRPTPKLQRTSSSPGLMARSMSLTTATSSKLAATATATAPLATATTSAHHANSPASSPMATAAGTSASAAAALKKSPQSLHGSQPSAISSHTSPLSTRSTNALDTDTKQRHGYYLHDPRKPAKANRAGTRGYRAPEVLLRVAHQTVAIDIWSVGVILFTLLTGRYPLFQAKDEADSLIEIASIFGMKEMKQCAAMHNRTFETNIETIPKLQRSLHKCCKVLNSQKYKHWLATDSVTLGRAIDLLEKMLVLDYTKRISAEDALKHPFLTN